MYRLESKLCEIRLLQAESARLMAEAIEAYKWPEELPIPSDPDEYGASEIDGVDFGEDFALEWACLQGCSQTGARCQITELMLLAQQLPLCWQRVVSGQAPLWQGQKVAAACYGLDPKDYGVVDVQASQGLGLVSPGRLFKLIDVAVMRIKAFEPDPVPVAPERCVRTGGDKQDPLTGWIYARLDRADTLFLEAIIERIADELAAKGDTASKDRLRAKALGMLSNPGAVIDLIGLPSLRGMMNPPEDEAQKQALVKACSQLAGAFTPKTQVYVHLHADTLQQARELARVENIGPVLVGQVKQLTQASVVKLTPVVHVGGAGEVVDMYETPIRIKDQVMLRDVYDVAPWSSIPSRLCDMDHTIPYEPGVDGQTRVDNLGSLSRRFHRAKTLAGWQLEQPSSGVFIWETPAGQRFQVDKNGTHRLPRRE